MTAAELNARIAQWCDEHRKATAVIVAVVVGLVIGAIVF